MSAVLAGCEQLHGGQEVVASLQQSPLGSLPLKPHGRHLLNLGGGGSWGSVGVRRGRHTDLLLRGRSLLHVHQLRGMVCIWRRVADPAHPSLLAPPTCPCLCWWKVIIICSS